MSLPERRWRKLDGCLYERRFTAGLTVTATYDDVADSWTMRVFRSRKCVRTDAGYWTLDRLKQSALRVIREVSRG